MTVELKACFLEMYGDLARGSIKMFLDTKGFKLQADIWISLQTEVTNMQQAAQKLAEVHPLAFLLLLTKEKQLRRDVRVVFDQQYINAWKQSIFLIASSFRLDMTPPHQRTLEGFAKSMLKHEEKNTLRLGDFLAQIPENQRPHVKQLVEEKRFQELFNEFLENFHMYQIS